MIWSTLHFRDNWALLKNDFIEVTLNSLSIKWGVSTLKHWKLISSPLYVNFGNCSTYSIPVILCPSSWSFILPMHKICIQQRVKKRSPSRLLKFFLLSSFFFSKTSTSNLSAILNFTVHLLNLARLPCLAWNFLLWDWVQNVQPNWK